VTWLASGRVGLNHPPYLLAQDVFTSIQSVHRVLVMKSMRRPDINHVDFRVGVDVLVRPSDGGGLEVRGQDVGDELVGGFF
jgi:hypothetical protein